MCRAHAPSEWVHRGGGAGQQWGWIRCRQDLKGRQRPAKCQPALFIHPRPPPSVTVTNTYCASDMSATLALGCPVPTTALLQQVRKLRPGGQPLGSGYEAGRRWSQDSGARAHATWHVVWHLGLLHTEFPAALLSHCYEAGLTVISSSLSI